MNICPIYGIRSSESPAVLNSVAPPVYSLTRQGKAWRIRPTLTSLWFWSFGWCGPQIVPRPKYVHLLHSAYTNTRALTHRIPQLRTTCHWLTEEDEICCCCRWLCHELLQCRLL